MNRFYSSIVVIFVGMLAPSVAGAFQQLDTARHVLMSQPVLIDTQASGTVWRSRDSLSPVQKKIESAIRELIQQDTEASRLTSTTGFRTWAKIDISNHVFVYLSVAPGHSKAVVTGLGNPKININPVSFDSACTLIPAWVNIGDLNGLAALPEVRSIRLVTDPILHTSPVISAGDRIMQANTARGKFQDAWGQNVMVGVISNDCGSREPGDLIATRIANDELPQAPATVDTRLDTYYGPVAIRTHEGLALMEIIHDLAPKASLAFADGVSNITTLCSNIHTLANEGCKVICDDVTFLEEPCFEDGDVANAVEDVVHNKDVVYVTSAGNFANDVYSFPFKRCRTLPALSSVTVPYAVQDFGNGNPYDVVRIPRGASFIIALQWSESFVKQPLHKYNLILLDDATKQVVYQTSSADAPMQQIRGTNSGPGQYYDVVVESENPFDGERLRLVLHSSNRMLPPASNGVSSILGHAMCKDVITCAATSAFGNQTTSEGYSSMGPDTLINREIRAKPDVTGIDQVATSVPGFALFSGTSAAAAHVAGLAAMIRSHKPTWKASQVRNAIILGVASMAPSAKQCVGTGLADAMKSIH